MLAQHVIGEVKIRYWIHHFQVTCQNQPRSVETWSPCHLSTVSCDLWYRKWVVGMTTSQKWIWQLTPFWQPLNTAKRLNYQFIPSAFLCRGGPSIRHVVGDCTSFLLFLSCESIPTLFFHLEHQPCWISATSYFLANVTVASCFRMCLTQLLISCRSEIVQKQNVLGFLKGKNICCLRIVSVEERESEKHWSLPR